jgi:hypothetical protein
MTPTSGAKHADGGVSIALGALLETCDSSAVGAHIAMHVDDHGFVVHEFVCELPGYPQWVWTVVLAHDVEADSLTVCDAVLLPGQGALVPPEWVPWSKRIQPGDLRPGDLLPSDPNDVRLMPGYNLDVNDASQDADVLDAVWEFGLGRERVLSPEGREDAAQRWWRGDTGPQSPDARMAPHPCTTCGFFVGIRGSLGAGFGVCSNEMSPADGRIVSVAFGCGAHSGIVATVTTASLPEVTLDETEYEIVQIDKTDEVAARADAKVSNLAESEAEFNTASISASDAEPDLAADGAHVSEGPSDAAETRDDSASQADQSADVVDELNGAAIGHAASLDNTSGLSETTESTTAD